eukprot:scaffold65299_cov33-Tisochrysis_lutea.AAC.1
MAVAFLLHVYFAPPPPIPFLHRTSERRDGSAWLSLARVDCDTSPRFKSCAPEWTMSEWEKLRS